MKFSPMASLADAKLPWPRLGNRQVDDFEHLGSAGAGGLYGEHRLQPRFRLKKASVRPSASAASLAS